MSTDEQLIKGIADTIQRVYGDATRTVLDERAAREIWKYLLLQGMARASDVALIVEAAGGEVHISRSSLVDHPPELVMFECEPDGDRVVKTRRMAA